MASRGVGRAWLGLGLGLGLGLRLGLGLGLGLGFGFGLGTSIRLARLARPASEPISLSSSESCASCTW